jgi:pilus assembly protein Flp/PilA
MSKIFNLFKQIVSDDSGQDLIEYALIAALIGLAAVATLKLLATSIEGIFSAIQTELTNAIG